MNSKTPSNDRATIHPKLAQQIQTELNQNVYLCYQCVKCTSGCPIAEFFDWQPNQILRALQLGQEDIAFESRTPWLCASCQTCTTRCPQNLDITAIMEFLTREALARGYQPLVPEVNRFNQAFLREVRLWGRAYEPGLMAEIKLRAPKTLLQDIDIYAEMLKKRKVALLPKPTRPPSRRKIKPLARASKAIAYYPGCSLESSATEFDTSARSVCQALGMDIIEPQGWICCGSSAAHRADPQAALQLPMENLSLIEQSGFQEVTMPCAACFNRHKTALFEIRSDAAHKTEINAALGYEYQDTVQVSTLIDAILTHVGAEGIARRVTNPLNGLRAVCYYGCLLTRPPAVTEASHPENPTSMDKLLTALGMEIHDWSYKTTCCGASHALTRPDIVLRLSETLIRNAQAAGAEVIAVACPLCHMNLDTRQMQMQLDEPIPVLYFTQLIAVAMGLPPKAASLHKNLVDPRPILQRRDIPIP